MKLYVTFIAVVLMFLGESHAFGCNVCHSKNPKMVKMHKELGYKDCFNCHGPGKEKPPEERKIRMVSDELCIGCHKK